MIDSESETIAVLLTHSRSCSTVVERVFWTNPDIKCFHEHFGDAYYFGPERVSDNCTQWDPERLAKTGKAHVTYEIALRELWHGGQKHKYVFNKDMSYHIIPPSTSKVTSVASLDNWDESSAVDIDNPTLLPVAVLQRIRFAFLIRSPWSSAPSLYKLHQPPAVYETGTGVYKAEEMGYREIRMLVEYLYPATKNLSKQYKAVEKHPVQRFGEMPVIVDAADVLADPEAILQKLSDQLGLPFSPSMLSWAPHDPKIEEAFKKFPGFHNDALASSGFLKRTNNEAERAKSDPVESSVYQQDDTGMRMTEAEYIAEWTSKWGDEGAGKILETVKLCIDDYIWLKQFVVRLT